MNGHVRPVNACFRVSTSLIDPGFNTRTIEEAIAQLPAVPELHLAMKKNGQETPIEVFALPNGRFEVFDGMRRLAAANYGTGIPELLVFVKAKMTRRDLIVRQVSMQAHTRKFEPIAEARACRYLFSEENMTRAQIAAALAKSEEWVRDRLALLSGLLTDDEVNQVERRELPMAEALHLTRQRRAARDGQPAPAPPKKKAVEKHFTDQHPLATEAHDECEVAHVDDVDPVLRIGGIACGACWEKVIRASVPARIVRSHTATVGQYRTRGGVKILAS